MGYRLRLILAAALGSTFLSSQEGHAQLYTVRDLGVQKNLAGRADGLPNGLNSSGSVAAANVVDGAYRAMLYTGAWKSLGTLGGPESFATALNNRGEVSGYSSTAAGVKRAFVWSETGTPAMKDLGTLGGSESEAYDINATGQVTGYSMTASGDAQVFLYSNGKMSNLGVVDSKLPNSFGYTINDAGHLAGAAYDARYSAPRAFIYDGSKMTQLGTLGGSGSTALAMNNQDVVVGYFTAKNGFDRAFQFLGGVMKDLGTLGGNYSYATAINSSNAVVGGSFVDTQDSVYHAFIFTGNTMTDLNGRLDGTGAGWTLVEARGINDAGQIVGTGRYNGVNHIFLLEPAVSVLRVATAKINGQDVILEFPGAAGQSYAVQSRDRFSNGSWNTILSGIKGNGGNVTATHSGGALVGERYYRVVSQVP